MKRLIVTVDGAPACAAEVRAVDREASRRWSAQWRLSKVQEKRKHRKLTDEQRAEKRKRTARRKLEREAQRDAREHERLMRRLKHLTHREEREAERARRIQVKYKPGREPKFKVVCPKALYRRIHTSLPGLPSRPAREAADGCRNIVMKRSCRGFGRKAPGTRAYKAGEAGRAARYIARPEGIEEVDGAVLTNVLGPDIVGERSFSIEQQQEIVGFFDALEQIEHATGGSHVYTHLILALPYELGAEGRAEALRNFCVELDKRKLPFSAALHKPDPEGSQRNFHAHVVFGSRPAIHDGPYSWSLEAPKFTEIISAVGTRWLRGHLAASINGALKARKSPIRYSGISQADRGVPALAETHKGQKQVALERKDEADLVAAQAILRGAAAHTIDMMTRLSLLKDNSRPMERQTIVADQEVSPAEDRSDVLRDQVRAREEAARTNEEQRELHEREVREVRKAEAPAPVSRLNLIMASLEEFGREKVGASMEEMAVALAKEPQTVALAMHNGRIRVAYVDPTLKDAISHIGNTPRELAWLTRMVERLSFDHARVPGTWNYVVMQPGGLLLPTKAEFWASQYGGARSTASHSIAAPDRGREV
jgi:hypothetical protein